MSARPSPEESGPIVRETLRIIEQGSTPSDRIFVWGFAPDLYLLAARRPATRFVYCTFVAGIIPHTYGEPVEGSWEMLSEDWATHPPLYVVDTTPSGLEGFDSRFDPTTFGPLADEMRDYELEAVVHLEEEPYFRIFRREGASLPGDRRL